ncbi:MAG: DUF87 domain-containing protein [Yaniella sp.]|nr:DUF87 domain-containing protein [Yaniella sp.]
MAFADSLRVGQVEFVSPDKIEVVLDSVAPDAIAINTGSPASFPRVNEYLLLPGDGGFTVGQIEWITVERSPQPQRYSRLDRDLVDIAHPMRRLSLSPVGVLGLVVSSAGSKSFNFSRGIRAFPTVGDPALLPTAHHLKAIVESGSSRRVRVGTSPLAADADVTVDPDRIFGRHLAILGSTGSGKSCSVAGLIRWSIDEARTQRELIDVETEPNARFIVLDPNGEYSKTFKDLGAKVFSVAPDKDSEQLQVPLWLWNTEEWVAFTQASSKTQRPVITQALRSLREGQLATEPSPSSEMRGYLRTVVATIQVQYKSGGPWSNFPKPKSFFEKLRKLQEGFSSDGTFSEVENRALHELSSYVEELITARSVQYPTYDFSRPEILELLSRASAAHAIFGGSDRDTLPVDADIPRPFSGDQFIRSLEAHAELLGVSEHVETLLMRVRTLLADSRLRPIVSDDSNLDLAGWLDTYLGNHNEPGVTVIDLSLVPTEVIHVVTSVIARMTLEALQRYRKAQDGKTFPTVLVMEEAHTFIRRFVSDTETRSAQEICSHTFEKIAREGRKFGLGLVLSSQRPSELSPTVLSQCNTFLLHRLSNHTDQDLVQRLVPDNMQGMLRDLPSLPSGNAILLGWASELPIAVEMRELSFDKRPRSEDPDFWNVWSGQDEHGKHIKREVNWASVAEDWQS